MAITAKAPATVPTRRVPSIVAPSSALVAGATLDRQIDIVPGIVAPSSALVAGATLDRQIGTVPGIIGPTCN